MILKPSAWKLHDLDIPNSSSLYQDYILCHQNMKTRIYSNPFMTSPRDLHGLGNLLQYSVIKFICSTG